MTHAYTEAELTLEELLSSSLSDFDFSSDACNSSSTNNSQSSLEDVLTLSFSSVQDISKLLNGSANEAFEMKHNEDMTASMDRDKTLATCAHLQQQKKEPSQPLMSLDSEKHSRKISSLQLPTQVYPQRGKNKRKSSSFSTTFVEENFRHENLSEILKQFPEDMMQQAISQLNKAHNREHQKRIHPPPIKKRRAIVSSPITTVTSSSSATSSSATETRASSSTLLHEACRRGKDLTVNELDYILKQEPQAIRTPVRLLYTKNVYSPILGRIQAKQVAAPYQYALNLAIYYQASTQVLQYLARAAPDVLLQRDGHDSLCSLHVLLRHKPQDAETANFFLAICGQESALWTDDKQNTALHLAVRNGSCLSTIQQLVQLHPGALYAPNFNGLTPLDLAQRYSNSCTEEVATFLRKKACERLE